MLTYVRFLVFSGLVSVPKFYSNGHGWEPTISGKSEMPYWWCTKRDGPVKEYQTKKGKTRKIRTACLQKKNWSDVCPLS